jgi:dethiobiotin synthetase
VGKTLLTVLLLQQLRASGVNALAMKPFCCGGTDDVDLIQAAQNSAIPRKLINPFYFRPPVAPLVAVRKAGKCIRLSDAVFSIRRIARLCDQLLIEGAGGIMVPLGEGFDLIDLIAKLRGDVVVVARNQLGTINHTLLTVRALQARGLKRIAIVLMDQRSRDDSARHNKAIIDELLSPLRVISLPYMGAEATRIGAFKAHGKKIQKTLACLGDSAIFTPRSLEHA